MTFDKNLFAEYKSLIKNTNIQKCYQHVFELIKYISSELEKDMTTYSFMNRVIENKMNYTYFQMTNKKMKALGLKIQVIFIHKTCKFEVWLSGYNRKVQNDYYIKLCKTKCTFEVCTNPNKNDYIVKIPINLDIAIDNSEKIISEIKTSINKLEKIL